MYKSPPPLKTAEGVNRIKRAIGLRNAANEEKKKVNDCRKVVFENYYMRQELNRRAKMEVIDMPGVQELDKTARVGMGAK
jgi:hypothetical protein